MDIISNFATVMVVIMIALMIVVAVVSKENKN